MGREEYAQLTPQERLVQRLRAIYQGYGYLEQHVGCFEEYEYYLANKNFLDYRDIISFSGLDGRLLALKPDVTLSLVKTSKASAQHTEKIYYHERVFRVHKQSQSYREIQQMGIEYLGAVDDYALAEVAALASQSLAAISEHYLLEVGHLGFLAALLQEVPESRQALRQALLAGIRSKSPAELRRLGAAYALDPALVERLACVANLYGPFPQVLAQAWPLATNEAACQALQQLTLFYRLLRYFPGATTGLQLDFSLVNDMDYYNGLVMIGYIEGLPAQVLSGGQYDQMMSKLGRDAGAVGFALGLSQLAPLWPPAEGQEPALLLSYGAEDDPLQVAAAVARLRAAGKRVTAMRHPQAEQTPGRSCRIAEVLAASEGEDDSCCTLL